MKLKLESKFPEFTIVSQLADSFNGTVSFMTVTIVTQGRAWALKSLTAVNL